MAFNFFRANISTFYVETRSFLEWPTLFDQIGQIVALPQGWAGPQPPPPLHAAAAPALAPGPCPLPPRRRPAWTGCGKPPLASGACLAPTAPGPGPARPWGRVPWAPAPTAKLHVRLFHPLGWLRVANCPQTTRHRKTQTHGRWLGKGRKVLRCSFLPSKHFSDIVGWIIFVCEVPAWRLVPQTLALDTTSQTSLIQAGPAPQ